MPITTLQSVSILDATVFTVSATTSGALQAGEAFQCSRRPDFIASSLKNTAPVILANGMPGTGNAYALTFPSSGPWYLRVKSAVTASASLPVVVDVTALGYYTRCGRLLQNIILQNKPIIDIYLQAARPTMSLQSCRYDVEWNQGDDTPSILIKPYMVEEQYEEMPDGKAVEIQYSITGIVRSNDGQYEADLVGQLQHALISVLDQKCYSEIAVPPDMFVVNGGMTGNHLFSDEFVNNVWVSRWSTSWKWEFIRYTS